MIGACTLAGVLVSPAVKGKAPEGCCSVSSQSAAIGRKSGSIEPRVAGCCR